MRQLSRLLKGECIYMDAAGFVYNNPACIKPTPEPECIIRPIQDEMEAAAQKARALVEGANRYLLKMHGQMRDQAKETFDSAREEGYRQGYEEGRAQALLENEQTLSQIAALLKEIDQGKDMLFKQYEQDMVNLALDIARKVVDAQLEDNDKVFLNIFRKAAEGVHGQKTICLHISQHEAQFVTSSSDYLLSLVRGAEHLDIEVQADAEPGTCILETEDALIDASAHQQLEKLTKAIEAVRQ